MSDSVRLKTPVGRLVGGSLKRQFDKDMQGRPTTPRWFFALAIEKNNPAVTDILNKLYEVAATGYANNQAVLHAINQSFQTGFGPGFAFKIDDGDNPKHTGKTGYAGCWIFKFGTTLEFLAVDGQNARIPLGESTPIELGHYCDVAFNTSVNGNDDHTAGLYLNPDCIRLVGYGEIIHTGPSPQELMGEAPALPAGASATPLAPAGAPPVPGLVPGAPIAAPAAPVAAPIAPPAAPAAPVAAPIPNAAPVAAPIAPPAAPAAPVAAPIPNAAPVAAPIAPPAPGVQTPAPTQSGTAFPTDQLANVQPHPGILNNGQ